VSNAVDEPDWITYLEASARSAVGGLADIEYVVKVTATIVKNYGMAWKDAGAIQDKIQLTAKNGVTSFQQLAEALPSVTGQAAQLGVSLDEMLGVMSTLTGVTGNTSEVSTQLASVLTALTKESAKSQKMAKAMGIEFNAASIKAAGGLQKYLVELDRTITAYANKTGVLRESIYSKLFGRAEAIRLVNGLTGQMAEKFGENIEVLKNSMGTMDDAFNEVASTGSSKLQVLKNQIGNLTDGFANAVSGMLPFLNIASQLTMTLSSLASLYKILTFEQVKNAVSTKAAAVATLAQASAAKIVRRLLLPYKGELLKTITTDNGSAFAAHKWISRALNVPVYFTDAYSSWQKGNVENTNKLVRQYIPKGTDISTITDGKIKKIMTKLNRRPREKLNFNTPSFMFYKNIS